MRVEILCWLLALGFGAPEAAAQPASVAAPPAERRVALVIGNSEYLKAPLKNPVNDARVIRDALRPLNFEVMLAENATMRNMEKAVSAFAAAVRPGDVALVFYSGHGIQVGGENYLIPTDFEIESAADVPYKAYSATRLLERLNEQEPGVTILILDACREDPFRATRGLTRGLAGMSQAAGAQKAHGTLIALATAPGDVAADSPDLPNSPFTTGIAKALAEQGLDQNALFDKVREYVFRMTEGRQRPYTDSGLVGKIYLHPAPGQPGFDAGAFISRSESAFQEGRSAIALSQWPAAEKLFSQVVEREKDTEMAEIARKEVAYARQLSLAQRLAEEGRPAEAARNFSEAWAMFPHRGSTGLEAADQFLLADDIAGAARVLAALRGSPDDKVAARASAMGKELASLDEEARRLLNQPAEKIDPVDDTKMPSSRRAAPVGPLVQAVSASVVLQESVEPASQELKQRDAGSGGPDIAVTQTREAVAGGNARLTGASAITDRKVVVRLDLLKTQEPAAPAPKPPVDMKPAPRRSGVEVDFSSAPDGAYFAVDGDPDLSCKAPCKLKLQTGRHIAVISLPGYRDERRIFQPGPGANSLSVSMQLKGGTLYIATAAAGALVMIDGVLLPLRTPAPITLAPGRYRVTLWADAILQSETEVEVRDQQSAVLSFK